MDSTRLKGSATAAVVEALFGAAWGIAGAVFLDGSLEVAAVVLAVVVTAVLVVPAVRLLRTARGDPDPEPEGLSEFAQARKELRWVVLLEAAAVVMVIRLLVLADLQPYVAPAVAIIVGLHFLPLARLFRTPTHYLTAILLSVAGLGVMVGLSMGVGSGSPRAWDAGVDIFSAVVLWCSAVLILDRTRNASRAMPGVTDDPMLDLSPPTPS